MRGPSKLRGSVVLAVLHCCCEGNGCAAVGSGLCVDNIMTVLLLFCWWWWLRLCGCVGCGGSGPWTLNREAGASHIPHYNTI